MSEQIADHGHRIDRPRFDERHERLGLSAIGFRKSIPVTHLLIRKNNQRDARSTI
ncbi:MAG: hypothetical protein M3082_08290 [Candidatus Dormibacteraeota bacterium]|nr:hypothetical protein [Candidatus Dormibacteraeota bacterium]